MVFGSHSRGRVFLITLITLLQFYFILVKASIFTNGNPGKFGGPRSVAEELNGADPLLSTNEDCVREDGTCLMVRNDQKELKEVEGKSGFKLMSLSPEEKEARKERARAIRAQRLLDEERYREDKTLERDVRHKMKEDQREKNRRLQKEKDIMKRKEERRKLHEKRVQEKLDGMNPEEKAYYEEQLSLEKLKVEEQKLIEIQTEEEKKKKKVETKIKLESRLSGLDLSEEEIQKLANNLGVQSEQSQTLDNVQNSPEMQDLSKVTQERLKKALNQL